MTRRGGQEGQALVGALVAMVFLFAVAGGLSVAVSAALDAGSRSGTYLRDATAQSSSAAVLSRVAGGSGACPSGTLFGAISDYGCDRIDAVSPSRAGMVKLVGSARCATAPLPAVRHVAVWLHSLSGAASLTVDGSPSCGATGNCVGGASPAGDGYLYAIRDCAVGGSGTAYVHVSDPSGSAAVARFAPLASFLPRFDPVAVGRSPAPILTARLRGSGQPLDLLVGNQGGGVTLLQGRGDGSFLNVATYASGLPVSAMTLADLDGNGSQYLVIGSAANGGTVTVLRYTGAAFQSLQQYAIGGSPAAIAAGQFLSDGNLDLAVAWGRNLTFLRGNGDGTFQSGETFNLSRFTPVTLAVIDAPGSRHDLVAGAVAEGQVRIYGFSKEDDKQNENGCNGNGNCYGNRGGKLTLVGSHRLSGAPTAIAAGSFFDKRYTDLAITAGGDVDLFFGHDDGDVQAGGTVQLGGNLSAVAAGDLGDGTLADIAVADSANNAVTPLLNDNGVFHGMLGGSADTGKQPLGLAIGDFDGSGNAGIAVVNSRDGTVTVLFRNRSRVFSVVGAGPPGTPRNEADLVWADPTQTNTLLFEGGLG
jgi:hypothetical protein